MIRKLNSKITFLTISAVLLLVFSIGLLFNASNQNLSAYKSSALSSYNSDVANQDSIDLDDMSNTGNLSDDYQGIVPVDDELFSSNVVTDVGVNDTIPSYYSLRDYYAIYTQNQASMGLCWAFTSNTVLESALAIKYNEMYDFSESYAGLVAKYNIKGYIFGNGGNLGYYYNYLSDSKYGVVLEADLPFENAFAIDNSNYQKVFNSLADDNFTLTDSVYFANFGKQETANTEDTKKKIKSHIMNNSAIYAAICSTGAETTTEDGYSVYYNADENNTVDHAVTIIGWDDNFKFVDSNNITHTGAWIMLNSWGNNVGNHGVMYIPYDDKSLTDLYGVLLYDNNSNPEVTISESNSNFTNLYNGKYQYNTTTTSENTVKQKNIFYTNQTIDLQYSYSLNDNDYNIKVYFDDVYNNSYENFKVVVNKNSKTIDINSRNSNVDAGTYVLKIAFDYNKDNNYDYVVTKEIFVMNSAEIGSVTIYQLTNNGNLSYSHPTYNYDYNSYTKNKQTFDITTSNDGFMITLELASYSKVISYSFDNLLTTTGTMFENYDTNNYSLLQINLLIIKNYSNINTQKPSTITIATAEQTYTLTFNIHFTSQVNNVYTYYDLDGGELSNEFSVLQTVDSTSSNIYVDLPTKSNYVVKGLYYDSSFTDELAKDSNGYYVTLNKLTKITTGTNYYDILLNNADISNPRYIVTIYVLWEKADYNLSYTDQTFTNTYGENLNITTPTLTNFSNNVEYYLLNAPTFVSLSNNKITGVTGVCGEYDFTLQIIDIDKKYNIYCEITLVSIPREVTVTIDNKSSNYLQDILKLTGSVTSGSVINEDNLNLQYSTTATNTSNVGSYSITGTYNNPNYNVTFIDGTYTILPINLDDSLITINNYNDTYDAQNHSASITTVNGATITYSTNKSTFTSVNPTYKNVSNNVYYAKITHPNYNEKVVELQVNITPYVIAIEWGNTKLVYNGQAQMPEYSYTNPFNEKLEIVASGQATKVSTNNLAKVTANNNNYTLSNNTCYFDIINAQFDVVVNNYEAKYDAKYHTITYKVNSPLVENLTVSYSVNGQEYTTEVPQFKDVQNSGITLKFNAPNFDEVTKTASVNIIAFTIAISWENKTLIYNGLEQFPAYTYHNSLGEDLQITENGKNVATGSYMAELVWKNKNYNISNPTYTYSIVNAQFDVEVNNYQGVYDAQNHTISYTVNSTLAKNVIVSYSVNGQEYTTEVPQFKDVQNSSISLKFTAQYFDECVKTVNVNITPYELTVVWGNTTLTYNGLEQFPEYTINNPFNEELGIVENGKQIYSGINYTATITLTNNNYVVTNNTITFKIESNGFDVIVNDYENVYDAQYHKISYQIQSAPTNNYKVEFSTDGEVYSTVEPQFKDVQNTTLYIKLTGDYVEDYIVRANVVITPYEITVKWTNTTLVYSGQEQLPTYTLYNSLNEEITSAPLGEEIEIITSGKAIYPSTNNVAILSTNNANYNLINNTCNFDIVNTEFVVTYENYENTYDAQYHTISYSVNSNLAQNYSVLYSLDNSQFTQEVLQFKDVQTTDVYIKFTAPYFNDYLIKAKVVITPFKSNVKWTNTTLTYNGLEQFPTYVVSAPLGEEISVTESGIGIYPNNYQAQLTSNSANYELNNATCEYTITNAEFVVTFSNYNGAYDGEYHTISFNVNSPLAKNYTVQYSLDNINYTDEVLQFKDVQTTNVYVKLSAQYFNDYIISGQVVISPYLLSVEWDDDPLTYNGQLQFPKYTILNTLNNEPIPVTMIEDLQIVVQGAEINAGDNYTALLQINNTNYVFEENLSCQYQILKANFDVSCTNYVGTYDNRYHTVEFQVNSTLAKDYVASYSLDGKNYTTQALTFKDAQTTNIYIKLTAKNFKDYEIEASVIITPYEINIVWGQTTLVYNGQKQIPSYSFTNANGEPIDFTPLNESINIIELGKQIAYHKDGYQAQLILQGKQKENYSLNNNVCNFNFVSDGLSAVQIPNISQSQVNEAKILSDIDLPQNYAWQTPSQEVKYGKHQYIVIYTDETLGEQTLYVTLDKAEPNYDFIYLIGAGVAVLIAIILIFVVIRSKKRADAFEIRDNYDKKHSRRKEEEFISQSKLSKDTKLDTFNYTSQSTQTNATPPQANATKPSTAPTQASQPKATPTSRPNVAPNLNNKPSATPKPAIKPNGVPPTNKPSATPPANNSGKPPIKPNLPKFPK